MLAFSLSVYPPPEPLCGGWDACAPETNGARIRPIRAIRHRYATVLCFDSRIRAVQSREACLLAFLCTGLEDAVISAIHPVFQSDPARAPRQPAYATERATEAILAYRLLWFIVTG